MLFIGITASAVVLSVDVAFTIDVTKRSPEAGEEGVSPYAPIEWRIRDAGAALDMNAVIIRIEERLVEGKAERSGEDEWVIKYVPDCPYFGLHWIDAELGVRYAGREEWFRDAFSFRVSRFSVTERLPFEEEMSFQGADFVQEANGTMHVAVNLDHKLYYVFLKSEGWEEAFLLDEHAYKAPIIRWGAAGGVHILWYSHTEDGDKMKYSTNQFGDFHEPVEFFVKFHPLDESLPYQMEVDRKSRAHLLWTNEGWSESGLYYTIVQYEQVLPVEEIDEHHRPYRDLNLYIDISQNVHALWTFKRSYSSAVCYMSKTGEEFSNFRRVYRTDYGFVRNARLTVDINGEPVAAWEEWPLFGEERYLKYCLGEEGEFGEPRVVMKSEEMIRFDLSSDSSDALHIISHTDGAFYYLNDLNGSFASPEKIRKEDNDFFHFKASVDDELMLMTHEKGAPGLKLSVCPVPRDEPVIRAAGWDSTCFSPSGPSFMTIRAWVYDVDMDLERVELYYGECPTGILLNDDGLNGDLREGDGIYMRSLFFPFSPPSGRYFFRIRAHDEAGHVSRVWPYFQIASGNDQQRSYYSDAFRHEETVLEDTGPSVASRRSFSQNGSLAPYILSAGFESTVTKDNPGMLLVRARVLHPLGQENIAEVKVWWGEYELFSLNDQGVYGDKTSGDGVYSHQINLPAGIFPEEFIFQIEAIDKSGKRSATWPYLSVP